MGGPCSWDSTPRPFGFGGAPKDPVGPGDAQGGEAQEAILLDETSTTPGLRVMTGRAKGPGPV
eukprot:2472953-Karenia_brevis.AAC.1